MACPNCVSTDLIMIDLAPGGRALRFFTCRSCEHRWWVDTEQSDVVSLTRVLGYVAGA